jgi:hypothetical protein
MTCTASRLLGATALAAALTTSPSAAQERPAGPTTTLYGFLLLDAFWNSGPFNSKDNANAVKVPTVADSGGSFIASARGSRVGLRLDGLDSGILAARLSGVLEFDFKGGHFGSSSAAWNAFGPRLRLAFGRAEWKTGLGSWQVVAGQDWGLLNNVNPNTVTYGCDPVFVLSGNIYRRTPQVKVGWEWKEASFGVGAAVAMLSPADADTQGGTAVDYGVGNKSRQPDLEARLAVSGKVPGVIEGTVGAGYHVGKRRYFFTSGTAGVHRDVDATLLGVDADLGITPYLQLKGEYYSGEAAEDGYSGAFAAVFPANPATTAAPPASFVAVPSDGWWGQATVKPIPELWLAAGYGTARASKGKLSATAASTRYQSSQLHGAVIVHAGRNLRFSFEAAQTESRYVVEGGVKAEQYSFATQVLF